MRKHSGLTFFIISLILFLSSFSLNGQSRIPGDPNNWLQVTKGVDLGGFDPVIVVFFQVPESYTGEIFFGIRDPEGNAATPDEDMDGVTDDTLTSYHLFGGDGCYTDPSARLVNYGNETTAAGHLTAGAPAIETLSYDYIGNETLSSGKDALVDNTWVYFDPVYATAGEKVGSNYFFRLVVDASNSTDELKNAFQLIASYSATATPYEITQIKTFSYSWCVDFRRTDANVWDFYPLVPDTRSDGTAITITDELNFFINDADQAGPYTLSDIGANLIDNLLPAGGAANQGLWISDTDGGSDYLLDPANADKVNGTWHLAYPTAAGGNDENTTEIYAENTGDPGVPLKIYSDFYKPKQAYRIKATTDPTDTDTVRTVTLQLVDSNENAVPYVRNIDITNSSGNCTLLPAATTVTTSSDGFYTFTCTDLVDETVTLTFASDGAAVPDRLSDTEPQGVNDTVTLVFNTGGTLPSLVSAGPDLNPITEGDSPSGIDFTITDTDGGNITAANGIRIAIPPTVNAAFDTSIILSSAISGGALSKIKTVTSVYENSRTIFIEVTSDFVAGDSIVVSGMALTSANSASTGDFVLSYSGPSGPYNILDSRDTDGAGTSDILINGAGLPFIWDGSTDSTFSTGTNWAGGSAPSLNDGTEKVIIPNVTSLGGSNPVIPAYNLKELIIDEGAVPTLSGNLDVTTVYQNNGTLRLTGSVNFGEAGTDAFDSNPSLGDVELDGSGNINYSFIDDLTVTSGAWVFNISQSEITINGNVTLSGTSLDFDYKPMHLYGNWTHNSGTILDGGFAGGALYLVGSNPSTISGNSTLFRLESTVPGKNIYFESGSTQTINGWLVMKGDATSDIVLRGTTASTWTIDMTGVNQDLSYVDVDWGTATTNTILCDYSLPIGVNCVNWAGSGVKITTWTGGAGDFLVTSAANWDLGVPVAGDTVYITGVNPPVLTADWNLTGSPVYINAGGSLNLGSFDLTCGTINNAGDMYLTAGSILTVGGIGFDAINTDAGTVHYSGGGTGLDWGNNYHNLTITDGAWTLNAELTVNGILTQEGGTLDGNSRIMNIYDDIVLNGGAFNLAADITVYRDFLSSGGTFTQTAGTTTFQGGTQTISGNHTWNNFANNSDNSTLIFTDGTTQTVNGDFTVQGSTGNLITLTGSGAVGWDIDILGTINIDFADISYSTAAAVAANGPYDAMNSQSSSGNNVNWAIFPGSTKDYIWQGDDATNPTVWSVGENWDVGSKPPAGANITIPAAAANPNPALDENVSLANLIIEAGTTLSTRGFDLSATGTFSNLGTLALTGIPGELISITTMDVASGLVRYEDGGADGTISFNGAAPDLFNLEIDDGGAGRNYALSGNLTLAGSLTMTSGTLGGAAQSLTVTGNAVLDSAVTFSGAAALSFNGGVSSLTGSVSSTNGSISLSGVSANITLTGQLDAGTGSVSINAGANEIHGDGDAAYDLRADTIVLSTTSTWIGSTNPIETASPGICDLQLPAGDVSIRINHTGAVTPNFGGDRTSILPLEIIAAGALTLPANRNISAAASDITLQGSTLTMAAGTGQLITTTGNISLTATAGGLALEHDLVTDGLAGNVTLTAYGAVTQTQPVTANLLTAETRVDGGAVITLNQTNSAVSINLQARNNADSANDAGNITYVDSDGFDIAALATTGDADLTCTAGAADDGTADVTQSAAIGTGGLVLRGTGDYLFDSNNNITSMAANVTGDIYFRDNAGFAISSVGGVNGLTATGDIYLRNNSNFGSPEVTQTQPVVSNGLVLHGNSGDFVLTQAGNSVNTLAISGQGTPDNISVSYAQNGNLTLGQVNVSGTTVTGCTEGRDLTLDLGTGVFIIDDVNVPDWILAGDFTLTADDFDDSLSNTVPGANLSTGGNVTLNLANAAPTAQTNTWIFNGTTVFDASGGNPISMNNVQIGTATAGGTLSFTGAASQDINGTLTVLNGAATSLDITNDTLTVAGNADFTNLDGLTSTGSTLTLNGGAAQTLTSNTLSLNNLTVNNAAGVTAADNITLTGNLTLTAGNLDIDGNNLAVTGTLFNNTNLLLTGAGVQTVSFGTMDTDSGTVTFDGAGTTLAGLTDFYDLTLTGAGARTFPAAVNVYRNLDASGVTAVQDLAANSTLLTFKNDGGSTGTFTPPATAADFIFYDMVNEAANVLTAAGDMVIIRNWIMNGSFVPGAFGVNFTTATAAAIDGNTNFNNFTCTAPGKTITMTAGDTHTINGVLTLTGTNAAIPTSLVTLTSTANWTFNHLGTESIDYAAIEYSQVTGFDISATNSVDIGLTCDTVSPGWIFAPKTVTWDGSTDTDWFTGANWDWGYIPNNTDNVIIADVANQPVIDPADPDTVTNNLTINAGATSSLEVGNGRSLTINGTFTNNADLIRSGTATVSKTDPLQGRTIYRNSNGNIQEYGGTDYWNLLIENTMTQTSAIGIGGALEITGTLNTNGNNLTVAGDITGAGGTLASSGGETVDSNGSISVAAVTSALAAQYFAGADFTPGAFTAGTSTVTLDGATASSLGGLTYYNLVLNKSAAGNTVGSAAGLNIGAGGLLTMTRGTWNVGAFIHTVAGNWDSSGVNFNLNAAGSTVALTGGSITIAVGAGEGFDNLNVNGACTLGSTLEVGGNLTIGGAGSLTDTGSVPISVGGSWTNSGSFDAANGTVTLTGAGAISGMNGTNDFYDLTITGGAHTTSNALDVANNTVISGGSLDTTGDAVTTGSLTLSGGSMANGTSLTIDTGDLLISNAGSTFSGAGATTVNPGNLNITAGNFIPSGTVNITAGNLSASSADTMSPTGVITVGGTSTFTGGTFTTSNTLTTAGLIRVNGAAAVLTANGTLNGNGGLQVSNGTLNGTGAVDITGTVTLDGGNLVGTGRTINVNGSWTESAGSFTDASGTVTIDGACTMTAISSFYNLTISADTTLASNLTVTSTLTQTGTATLTSPAAQNITVIADLDLTGTGGGVTFSAGGILNVGTTTDLTAGTAITLNGAGNDVFTGAVTNGGTISVGNGTVSFGNTVTNTGTLTSSGTGNITFAGNYAGGTGAITDTGGNSNWIFQADAAFAGVVMTGDGVIFNTAGIHAVSVTGANSFDQVDIVTGQTVNLSGLGTMTMATLVIDTAGTDNGTAVFDAGATNFAITTLDNSGRFRLEGSQGTQSVTNFDTGSGWLEYYGGAGVIMNNADLADLWNLEISSGTYTLGQNIQVLGTGNNYDGGAAYDDEGFFLTGGTLNGSIYSITVIETFTVVGGTFNCDTSEVIFTGATDGYINGNIRFFDLTCSYVAHNYPPLKSADLSVTGKDLYFNPNETTTIAAGGHLTLSGNPAIEPSFLPSPPNSGAITQNYEPGTSFLSLKPATPPADLFNPSAAEHWYLNMEPGADLYTQYICVWFSDAQANPFVLQPDTYAWECPGWLEYTLVINSVTEDSDLNGKIDRIICTTIVALDQSVTAHDGFEVSVQGYDVIDIENGSITTEFNIVLQEKPYLDTDATPTWQIVTNTSFYDALGTKLVVVPPYTADNSSTQTAIDNAAPVIGYTLAVPGNNQLFIHFSEPVERGVGVSPLLADFNFGGIAPASATGLTPVTVSGTGYEEVLVDFDANLDMGDCLNGTVTVTAALQDMATVPIPMDLGLNRNILHNATDILAGPAYDGPVEPLWAADQTTASSSGPGTGVINEFDGTQHLKDEDITLQAHLSTDIPFASLAGSPIELRFIQNPAYVNGNGLWMDNGHDSTAPFILEDDWSGLVPYVQDSSTVVSVNGAEEATNNQVWNFNLSGADMVNSADLSFLFYLPTIDRYTARIDDHTASNWYRRFYPWSFGIHNIVDQGNGVSILNNVINPLKGEEAILYYNLTKAGMISVQIFDLAGGLVEILHRGRQDAGEYTLVWNGTNRSNTPVARGIYFVRIVGPSMDEMRKVLVIK